MDFVYLFRVLLKKKWLIIGSAVLAGVIAWFLTRNEKYNYRSSSRISTGFAVPDGIRVNGEEYKMFDAEVKFNNAITTWTSPPVISLLSYELILHDLKSPSPFRKLTEKETQSSVYKDVDKAAAIKIFQDKLDSMSVLTSYRTDEKKLLEFLNLYKYGYQNIIQSLNIGQVPRTDYIQVEFVSEHPDLSAFVVNHVFEQFIRYYRGIKSTTSQESVDTLKSIMDRKKQELDEKKRMLGGGGTGDAETANASIYDLISELEKSLTTEKSKQTDNNYELVKMNQKIANLGTGTVTNSSNNEEMIIARKEMNNAYSEYLKTNDKTFLDKYNQLKAVFNAKYANSTVTTQKTDNRQELLDKKNDLLVDIQASEVKIRSLEARIGTLKSSANSASSRDAVMGSMQEEMKLAEREYLDAQQKYNNAFDMSSSAVNNFRQLQIAQPAIMPDPSKRKILVAMAGVVTFLGCILIITLLAYLDSSIKTPVIFSKMVNLKLISMVNFMNLKNKNLKDIVTGHIEEDRAEKNRSNVFRESVRKLRYEIEKSGKKIFLFTSTKKGQGKTTLIQALSYSMSLSKKKILIIDTNFCNNDLTVQMEANPILEKITAGKGSQSLFDQIKPLSKDMGEEGNIYVIGSEGGDYTPSEILPRENLLKHLHTLTSDFDYIFLEGPPLNDFSDSKELIQYVDGVVGIFSAKHIIKQIDKESISFYKDLDGKFIGSVLNMVDLENVNTI